MEKAAVVGLSMRAYARSRAERGLPGGTLRAVQKAAERGRVVRFADGSVDAAASDVAWEAEMDPRMLVRRGAVGEVLAAAGRERERVAGGGVGGEADGETAVESETAKLTRYRAEIERLKAEDARERRALRAGQLLDAAEVMAANVTMAAEVRTFFLNFVNDVSSDLAAALGADERRVWIELNRLVKAALSKQVKEIESGIAA